MYNIFKLISVNSYANYAFVVLVILGFVALFTVIKNLISRYLGYLKHTKKIGVAGVLNEALKLFSWPLYLVISINIGTKYLTTSNPGIEDSISFAVFVIITVYIILIIQKFIKLAIDSIIKNRTFQGEDPDFDPSGLLFLEFGFNVLVWIVGILFVLQNRNININALVGGLGVAGIAFAFALQNLMADLFASVSIYTDKPFVIGDYIQIGDDIGEVVKIGLKTTRVKLLKGGEIVVSNKELSTSKIKNLSKVSKRSVFMEVKVQKNEKNHIHVEVPSRLKQIVNKTPKTKFYAAYLKEATQDNFIFSLEFEVAKMSYRDFLSVQNTINMSILESFGEDQIQFKIV